MLLHNQERPTISVIVPAYNCAQYVSGAIRSCLEQSEPPNEIIVIDDGSVDGTIDALRAFTAQPSVRVLQQTNQGVSAARNAGVRASAGTFVAFLDADDELRPHALRARRDAIISHPEVDVLFSDYCISDALGLERSAHQALAATRMLAVYAEATSRDAMCLGSEFSMAYLTSKVPHSLVHTSAITVRRTLFDETGGFTPGMQVAEDYDLWSRCFAKGNCKTALLLGDPQSVYFRWRGSAEKYEAVCLNGVRRLRNACATTRPFSLEWHRIRRQMALEYLRLIYWLGVERSSRRTLARALWRSTVCYPIPSAQTKYAFLLLLPRPVMRYLYALRARGMFRSVVK